jgi:hypothetical protein
VSFRVSFCPRFRLFEAGPRWSGTVFGGAGGRVSLVAVASAGSPERPIRVDCLSDSESPVSYTSNALQNVRCFNSQCLQRRWLHCGQCVVCVVIPPLLIPFEKSEHSEQNQTQKNFFLGSSWAVSLDASPILAAVGEVCYQCRLRYSMKIYQGEPLHGQFICRRLDVVELGTAILQFVGGY